MSIPKFIVGVAAFGLLSGAWVGSSIARESRAHSTTQESDEKAIEAAEAAHWKEIEPEVLSWVAKGKPYVPGAAKSSDLPQAKIPAFPGAEGGGMYSFGGRGGKVYVVTSLDDSGPGTYREALEAAGPRIVVFGVAGIIHLDTPVTIQAPYITIVGNTAPGDGICIAGPRTTNIQTHDVVIRYMRFRRGATDPLVRDHCLSGDAVGNVIIDHCSCSWGLDENISLYKHIYHPDPADPSKFEKLPTVNLTIQWCISSEALDPQNHAFGGTWGGTNDLFHHNLFCDNTGRNCSIGFGGDFNFIDNVVFNWRHRTLDGGDETSLDNVINNYFKPGPATMDTPVKYRVLMPQPNRGKTTTRTYGKYYVSGNVVVGNDKVTQDNWDGGVQFQTGAAINPDDPRALMDDKEAKGLLESSRVDKPFPMPTVTIDSAQDAFEKVLASSGATLPHRDSVDDRAVRETRTGQVTYTKGKGIITNVSQVGGYPTYAGDPINYPDHDGIPDWWKQKYGLPLHDASVANQDLDGDGYTNIEKYIFGIDPTHKLDYADPKNNVNPLVGKFDK